MALEFGAYLITYTNTTPRQYLAYRRKQGVSWAQIGTFGNLEEAQEFIHNA